MLKFLKGVVGGSGAGLKDLMYKIGEPHSSAWGSWVHYRGTSKKITMDCLEEDVVSNSLTDMETAKKRKERRKAAKKEKRKKKRKEIAEMVRQQEAARLNDPEEQRRLQAEEEQERLRAEEERRHFEEMERKIQEAWEIKKALEEKEEEQGRRRAAEEEILSEQNQVGLENEVDDDDWEYVEAGPSEIIWQGNEIIVKKKKIRVKKKDTNQQNLKEVHNWPTSNPLPPQSEAFADHKSGPSLSAQQLLDTVAHETPNFGTEQDKAHCPFHLKTGACRFGSRCCRVHFYPNKSCTLLIKNMHNGPGLAWEQDEGLEFTDEEAEHAYEEFYEDVHTEFLKFGEIINFKVCKNGSSHLRGNVYVHYKSLDSAVLSYQSVNGRFFAGKQLQCEFVGVTKWRAAICGEFMKSKLKTCSRGTACNFIHCFKNPGGDYEWADWDKPPPRYWVKEMAALFGYSDESGCHKNTEQGSPRSISYCSTRSLSKKTESSSHSRNYSDDDSRSCEPRRHHNGSDKKHSKELDREQHGDATNSREKRRHNKSVSVDHASHKYWLDMDGIRQSYSSNLSPACRKRKSECQVGKRVEMNIYETDSEENMHDNNLDPYYHEPSRKSRRYREKQSAHIYGEKESPSSDGSEEFQQGTKSRRTHKPMNSSNWDNSDGGNGKFEHDSESLRDSHQGHRTVYSSKYNRKDRQRAERGEFEKQFSFHHEKSQRKRAKMSDVGCLEAVRSHDTDNQIDESNDKRGRWEPGEGDST